MATSPNTTTTVLGKAYAGRPRGLALRISNLEQAGEPNKAQCLLDAHNRIRMAFGHRPYDLPADFTNLPMEGGFAIQAVPTVTVTPRPLNSRLWELVAKETSLTIDDAERSELDAICIEIEGASA